MIDLSTIPDDALLAELERRRVVLRVGYCYPAMASDDEATELIHEHGYEYGPWQFLEFGQSPAASSPSWPLLAQVPEKFRFLNSQETGK